MKIQVNEGHYVFSKYMHKRRWMSLWKQVDLILNYSGRKVLEIGPGNGVLQKVLGCYGCDVSTMDIDSRNTPTVVGSITDFDLEKNSFDIICAFQVLEHIPYEGFLSAIENMVHGSRSYAIFSIPNCRSSYCYSIKLPFLAQFNFFIDMPFQKPSDHVFDGEHYWELEKSGYEVRKVVSDLKTVCEVVECFRLPENPYHHFFVVKER